MTDYLKIAEECAPYLKEGETPAQRIQREIDDNAAVLGLLAEEKRKTGYQSAEIERLKKSVQFLRSERPMARRLTELEQERDRLREALEQLLIDVAIAQYSMRHAAKTEPRWEGCAEAIQPRVDAAKDALAAHPKAEPQGAGKHPIDVEIFEEIKRAVEKFPTWPTDPLHALAVLGEEFGELTKEALQLVYEPHKTSPEEVRKEAIQTAAMALRFARSLHVYEYRPGIQHSQGIKAEPQEGERDE